MPADEHRLTPEDIAMAACLLGFTPEQMDGPANLVGGAKALGTSPSTLRRRALDGQIGFRREGRGWRFSWHDLACYVLRMWCPPHPPAENLTPMERLSAPPRRHLLTIREDVAVEARQLGLIGKEGRL